ncbi:hypothetical protein HN51_041999 [Arachis hypogaea]|uniref:Uncharacterized protein n=1 Tax=Arachis hypogaea TaxID=3818 RepID=A0A444YV28_ARAHY|nr:(-)-germacrene D synthase [Arachis hypogaea]QHN87859.1 (-)-germacrene D synthase [Arachis hypogaea]RYR05791.1 hypothetical protein Ahy_B06g085603 [Arachis hypogaea]
MSLAASASALKIHYEARDDDFKRPFVKYSPNIWGNIFLQFDSDPLEVYDNTRQQDQVYKEKVRMYLSSSNNILEKLSIIDSIQQLDISYHFEDEIGEALEQIYNDLAKNRFNLKEENLHFHSLLFRLLRQKGFHILSDIFNKFKNNKGKFNNEMIGQDVQGIWSLYEAAQLSIQGEDILEEAIDFTYANLKSRIMLNNHQLSPTLATHINQCLRQPIHRAIPRVKSRSYISLYEKDPSHNKDLLAFAKLDFNMLQKMHQNEVGSNTKWWRELEMARKVPYTRDRVVEAYFWSLIIPEPKYSIHRRILGKLITCIATLDDTYDNYGTIQELELFTQAMHRWDMGHIESLPECMKVAFSVAVKLCDEIELETAKNGNSTLVLQYVKQAFFNFVQGYLVEAKWCDEKYVPTYEEYKMNGIATSTCPLQMTILIGLGEFATKDMFDWILNNPKVMKAVSLIARLMDDLGTHKVEQEREHVASAVECCMKQYDVSEEDAYKLIQNEIKGYWKDINEACLINLDNIPKHVLDLILGLARAVEFTYSNIDDAVGNFEDKFSNGQLSKDYVVALLLDPIVS